MIHHPTLSPPPPAPPTLPTLYKPSNIQAGKIILAIINRTATVIGNLNDCRLHFDEETIFHSLKCCNWTEITFLQGRCQCRKQEICQILHWLNSTELHTIKSLMDLFNSQILTGKMINSRENECWLNVKLSTEEPGAFVVINYSLSCPIISVDNLAKNLIKTGPIVNANLKKCDGPQPQPQHRD